MTPMPQPPADPPRFATRDPGEPGFWDERFRAGFMPWDAGGAAPAFLRWLQQQGSGRGRRVLVPGCGRGYEAAALDTAGFDVLAIDYAAEAVAQARAVLGAPLADRVLRQADFFDPRADWAAAPFDLVFERAFVAALPPALWPRWADRVAALLRPGGSLCGLFVIDPEGARRGKGPPFATEMDALHRLLDADFQLTTQAAVPAAESLPVFAGRERWLAWTRRPVGP